MPVDTYAVFVILNFISSVLTPPYKFVCITFIRICKISMNCKVTYIHDMLRILTHRKHNYAYLVLRSTQCVDVDLYTAIMTDQNNVLILVMSVNTITSYLTLIY